MVTKLKDIYFGEVEGKDEVNEVKSEFENVFYNGNNSYNEMLLDKKFLIIGRKGTGKTLLAEYFKFIKENEDANNRTKTVNCEIYDDSAFVLKKLEKFSYSDIIEEEMIIFWEYFFLIQIGNQILESNSLIMRNCSIKLKKLKKIVDNYTFRIEKYNTTNRNSSDVNSSIGVSDFIMKASSTESNEKNNYFVPNIYYQDLPKLKKLIMSLLRRTSKSYFSIYDDIDELEIIAKKNNKHIVFTHSMIKTAKRINSEFLKSNINVKIYILLRKDMSDELIKKTNNFNKIVISNGVELSWQYNPRISDVYKQPLAQMIIQKIKLSSETYKGKSDKEVYETVMPRSVSGKNAIKYLIDFSFGRPRDFVMFLNIVKKQYSEQEFIKSAMMRSCINQYSKQFWNELESELNRNDKKEELMDCILLIKDLGKNSFSLELLLESYEKNKERYTGINDKSDFKELLTELYKYSIIGTSKYVQKGKQVIPVIEFYYRDNISDTPNFNDYFSIHFALRSALNII